MPTPVRNRPSLYRRDTAAVLEGPDYAEMYARFGEQSRRIQRYGEQVRRTRMHDFNELTKVSLNANITNESINKMLMGSYGKYRKLATDYVEKHGLAMGPEYTLKLQEAQAEFLKHQSVLADANQRYDYSRKLMFENPGVYSEEAFNTATNELKEGKIPASFLKFTAIDPGLFNAELARDMEQSEYVIKGNIGDKLITNKYSIADLTGSGESSTLSNEERKRMAGDIIENEMKTNPAYKQGVLEDWGKLTAIEKANAGNIINFGRNNPEYLVGFDRRWGRSYTSAPKATDKGGGGKYNAEDDGYNYIENLGADGSGGYDFSTHDDGKGVRMHSVKYTNPDTGKTVIYKDAVIDRVFPEDDMAFITVPKLAGKSYDELLAEGIPKAYLDYSMMTRGIDESTSKDQIHFDEIPVPFSSVSTQLKQAGITLNPREQASKTDYGALNYGGETPGNEAAANTTRGQANDAIQITDITTKDDSQTSENSNISDGSEKEDVYWNNPEAIMIKKKVIIQEKKQVKEAALGNKMWDGQNVNSFNIFIRWAEMQRMGRFGDSRGKLSKNEIKVLKKIWDDTKK